MHTLPSFRVSSLTNLYNRRLRIIVLQVKLAVYYESLCPNSHTFISSNLKNIFNTYKLNVRFIPFGKAHVSIQPRSRLFVLYDQRKSYSVLFVILNRFSIKFVPYYEWFFKTLINMLIVVII